MGISRRPETRTEYGDFQTPKALADRVCKFLSDRGFRPAGVLEPSCGRGAFLAAAITRFPSLQRLYGFDIDPRHVAEAKRLLERSQPAADVEIRLADFFVTDWRRVVRELPQPLLILGNPPWVTNAGLGRLGSRNLPVKSNPPGQPGIDALTGKSNFDISEWMLVRALEWVEGSEARLAVLCKTAVARKVLRDAWKRRRGLRDAEVRRIDTRKHFGVSVDACLLLVSGAPLAGETTCAVYDTLESPHPSSRFGIRDGHLVADMDLYDRWKHLAGFGPRSRQWRSGVKHDAARVMELRRCGPDSYVNGLGNGVVLERRFVFPMLKGSGLANGAVAKPNRWMLVPQARTGQATDRIASEAPRTWSYLCAHADSLDRRRSRIYRNRPRFSVFGVGPYTFRPWRVAIAGFYRKLDFQIVGSFEGKPIVLDDTCCFWPCGSESEAIRVRDLLHSRPAQEFLGALVFPDSKRPVTAGLLGRLDLAALSREAGASDDSTRPAQLPNAGGVRPLALGGGGRRGTQPPVRRGSAVAVWFDSRSQDLE